MKIMLLTLLSLFSIATHAADCGIEGTLEARIANCAKSWTDASGANWQLVTRVYSSNSSTADDYYRVWLNTASGRLFTMSFLASQVGGLQKICIPNSTSIAVGRITAAWKIASLADYKALKSSQALFNLLKADPWEHWTDVEGQMFNPKDDSISQNHPANAMPTVCTAKI